MTLLPRPAAALLVGLIVASCLPCIAGAQARTPLVQSIDVQIPTPPIPVRIAGKRHLAYELHITNFRPFDVALSRVEVRGVDQHTLLAEFRDSALTAKLGRPGARSDLADKRIIGAGMRAVVYLWFALDDAIASPSALSHLIEVDLIRPAGRETVLVEAGTLRVRSDPPLVLGPPLRGGPWVALYDPLLVGGHRTSIYTLDGRARIPSRYAIDWIRLGDDASLARGDASRIVNWHGYGADVLAVADGTVSAARDDITEDASTPSVAQTPIPLENASGNYVTLDLGKGRYAFYEHLKYRSIAVKVGDRVKQGQVIGKLGNSGSSSSGPHLHFHVSDANATLAAEGLPFVFSSFEVLGAFASIGAFASGQLWKAPPDGAGGKRLMELPFANTVIRFGAGGSRVPK